MSWESPSDRSVWKGNRETEANPVAMTINPEEQGVLSEEYQPVTECVPAEMPLAVPVTGESFCECPTQTDLSSHTQPDPHTPECTCGEDESGCAWLWDEECRSPAVFLSCSSRKVCFHPDYSCGTAALRGSEELRHGQHFWEIKMTSPVYGTDMMVGIGTAEVNLDKYTHSFCSLLGADAHSWGLSYTGLLHHKGSKVSFSPRFGQGSIIGLHLDTWHGTLTFYKNRQWIGVVSTGLQNKSFYPMVCSTAAKSSMKLISSFSTPTSLSYLCCSLLCRYLPDTPETLATLPLPPGLKLQISQQLGWVLRLRRPEAPERPCAEDDQQDPGPCQDANQDAYPDSTSYPDDATTVCLDSAPDTPAGTYLTCYPDSASYDALNDANAAYPDSAPCTPTYTHLTSDTSSASCAPVHMNLTSQPDPTSYLNGAAAAPPESTSCTPADTHLTSYPDSSSCRDISLHADPDLFSDPGSCSDPTSCPCCDAPLSFATCDNGDYPSCASCCSGPASRPASPLPDHPYASASSLPDSTHSRPSSASGTDTDECTSETCQRKRCRWT